VAREGDGSHENRGRSVEYPVLLLQLSRVIEGGLAAYLGFQ